MSKLYDGDVVAWARKQAALLRSGRLERIDALNIAEEIEERWPKANSVSWPAGSPCCCATC